MSFSEGYIKGAEEYENEEIFINNIQQGDRRAFRLLMKEYFEKLAGFSYQYVDSTYVAKDIVQDVFVNIWEMKDDWNPEKSLKLYLYQSVKNESFKYLRDKRTEEKYIEAYIDEHQHRKVSSPELDDTDDFKQAVQRAVQSLPERARMAYKLHRRDGLTYKEIAKVMEISHKTVESQISRALKKLREQLSDYLPAFILGIFLNSIVH